MNRPLARHGLKIVVFIALAASAAAWIVMHLWNWALVGAIGVHPIGFAQALGLLALCRLLLGRWGPRRHWRDRLHARWHALTPEQRAAWRGEFAAGHGCRTHAPDAG